MIDFNCTWEWPRQKSLVGQSRTSLENIFRGLRTSAKFIKQETTKTINLGLDKLYKLYSIMNSYVLLYLYVSACCGTMSKQLKWIRMKLLITWYLEQAWWQWKEKLESQWKAFPVGKLIILRKWFEKGTRSRTSPPERDSRISLNQLNGAEMGTPLHFCLRLRREAITG